MNLLTEKKDAIEALAEVLLEKETISLPDIVDTLGPRPFPAKAQLNDYLAELRQRQEEDAAEKAQDENAAERAESTEQSEESPTKEDKGDSKDEK